MAELEVTETEAKAEAAFGAGFGDTPPAPVEKVVTEVPAEAVTAKEAVVAPAAVPEKPQYIRLTKQEWDNTKAAAGKVSSLESQVAKLMGSTPKAEQIVQQVLDNVRSQTPAGLDVEMSDEDFAELAADFPELARSTRAALEKIFRKANVKGTGPAQSPVLPVDMDAAFEKWQLGREANALVEAYPDWSDIVGRPPAEGASPATDNPFRAWLATQPAEYQAKVGATNSPAVVQAAIDRFKASEKSTQEQPAAPSKGAVRRTIIEDAVTPRADGNPPPPTTTMSAEEAFAKAFKAARAH